MSQPLFFPAIYNFGSHPTDGIGGEPVSDCGTIYVADGDDLKHKTTISEVVDELIEHAFITYNDVEPMPDDRKRCWLGSVRLYAMQRIELKHRLGRSDMTTAERLKKIRDSTGYTCAQMADLCGVTEDHYRKYEHGDRETGLLRVHALVLEFLLRKRLLAKFYKFWKRDKANVEKESR